VVELALALNNLRVEEVEDTHVDLNRSKPRAKPPQGRLIYPLVETAGPLF